MKHAGSHKTPVYTVYCYYPSGRSKQDRTYKTEEGAIRRMEQLSQFNQEQAMIGLEPVCDYRYLTSTC